ncbi:esterase-like activity of phytase family protein [Streptomyces sp. C10]|uniref:esterase-like activity of phytase family protein n=1 Tax=Streptomyces sp. C10 TaxID=531941 RepID=UPI00397F6294
MTLQPIVTKPCKDRHRAATPRRQRAVPLCSGLTSGGTGNPVEEGFHVAWLRDQLDDSSGFRPPSDSAASCRARSCATVPRCLPRPGARPRTRRLDPRHAAEPEGRRARTVRLPPGEDLHRARPVQPVAQDTGVPAILAFPDDPSRYLVLERTWVAGAGFKIRIYDATTRGATEVQDMDSLAGQPAGRSY